MLDIHISITVMHTFIHIYIFKQFEISYTGYFLSSLRSKENVKPTDYISKIF
jgi:hypothetical protein